MVVLDLTKLQEANQSVASHALETRQELLASHTCHFAPLTPLRVVAPTNQLRNAPESRIGEGTVPFRRNLVGNADRLER